MGNQAGQAKIPSMLVSELVEFPQYAIETSLWCKRAGATC